MDAVEKRLAAGLLFGMEGHRTREGWVEAFRAALGKQPSLVGEPGDLTTEQTAAWEQFKASQEGRSLLEQARYRIAWRDRRAAASWARSLASQLPLCGQGRFIDAASPVEVVEWKWPLAAAVMEDAGYAEAQAEIAKLMDSGPPWLKALVRRVGTPADQAGAADILIFPQGWNARQTLLGSRAPVTADLLVLCGLSPDQFGEAAAGAEELLAFTQANAVLAVDSRASGMSWLPTLIEHLAHDEPLDVAAQGLCPGTLDPAGMLLLSTPLFIERARLSTFVGLLAQRLEDLEPNHLIELHGGVPSMPPRMAAAEAAEFLKRGVGFGAESQGASVAATVAAALPPPAPAPVRRAVQSKKLARVRRERSQTANAGRFLLSRIIAGERTRFEPAEALEAGKRYRLHVHIGRRQDGYLAAQVSLPEPPVQREDAGAILTVVFFEKNSKPEAELKPIFLPRAGDSSACEFEFVASPASSLFEGWVSVYHNNRLLQEGVLRARVEGAAQSQEAVAETSFTICSSPRPLELGLAEQRIFAGAIRLEGNDTATGVRGYRTARVNLPGLKRAVESLEAAFNRMPWEDIGTLWAQDAKAAKNLALIAQEGWQLRDALCANPLFEEIEQSPEPLVVYAADANVRAPLELCYMGAQPKSTAKICPRAAEAVAQGRCVDGCEGRKNSRDHVCPMAFWSLSRVIEWRSAAADGRDPDALEVTNEPAPGRRALQPLCKLLVARSEKVDDDSTRQLREVLNQKAPSWKEARSWEEWEDAIKERPTMLVLMPHVENDKRPPLIEIQSEAKDPPGIDDIDVIGDPPQQPFVLILGCGAATSSVDFQSLPAQFRRRHAAAVLAPLAEVPAADAPEMARALIETLAEGPQGSRPLGDVVLATKRRLVAEGKLTGLLLLAFGDADWLV